MGRLDGKIAAVTGGASGIGEATVRRFVAEGAIVAFCDRDGERGQRVAAELETAGAKVAFTQADVGTEAACLGFVNGAAQKFGRLDILVNNAGIARSETPAETVTDEHWLNVLDVNLNGTFWCCRAFGKHMLQAKAGTIVNVGSMSGFIVNKPQEQSYYNASKAAVHHLTKSLAAEWGARGVRVNAVAPTYIDTPLNAFVKSDPRMYDAWIGGTPMARLGQVDEIASVVLFLASDAASLMTGSIVLVDGGYTCW
jgi:NAD(P)-dependent dehydrogenase (short-subunit alcohol dehydrogenase family)